MLLLSSALVSIPFTNTDIPLCPSHPYETFSVQPSQLCKYLPAGSWLTVFTSLHKAIFLLSSSCLLVTFGYGRTIPTLNKHLKFIDFMLSSRCHFSDSSSLAKGECHGRIHRRLKIHNLRMLPINLTSASGCHNHWFMP